MIVVNAKIKLNVKNFIFMNKTSAKIIKMETVKRKNYAITHIFVKVYFYYLTIQTVISNLVN